MQTDKKGTERGRIIKLSVRNNHRSIFRNKVVIQEGGVSHILMKEDIEYCRAAGNYSVICLKKGKQIVSATPLKSIEKRLESNIFFRIHQGVLVNLECIEEIRKEEVQVASGATLPISRRKRKPLMETLTDFQTI